MKLFTILSFIILVSIVPALAMGPAQDFFYLNYSCYNKLCSSNLEIYNLSIKRCLHEYSFDPDKEIRNIELGKEFPTLRDDLNETQQKDLLNITRTCLIKTTSPAEKKLSFSDKVFGFFGDVLLWIGTTIGSFFNKILSYF